MPLRDWDREEESGDDDDWGSEDHEYDESSDDDEEATIPCPHCRQQIHEDSQRCPYCERYLSSEDSPAFLKPRWIVAGVVVCLIIVFLWVVGHR